MIERLLLLIYLLWYRLLCLCNAYLHWELIVMKYTKIIIVSLGLIAPLHMACAIKKDKESRSVMKPVMHETRISIPEKNRIELTEILNKSLGPLIDLYAQAKQAHWNVKGPNFIALHKMFDDLAGGINGNVDTFAERITSLGGTAFGTIQDVGQGTILKAYPNNMFAAPEVLRHLAHNLAIMGEHARSNIKRCEQLDDYGTGDIYIQLSRFLDKQLWFVEAHLQS